MRLVPDRRRLAAGFPLVGLHRRLGRYHLARIDGLPAALSPPAFATQVEQPVSPSVNVREGEVERVTRRPRRDVAYGTCRGWSDLDRVEEDMRGVDEIYRGVRLIVDLYRRR